MPFDFSGLKKLDSELEAKRPVPKGTISSKKPGTRKATALDMFLYNREGILGDIAGSLSQAGSAFELGRNPFLSERDRAALYKLAMDPEGAAATRRVAPALLAPAFLGAFPGLAAAGGVVAAPFALAKGAEILHPSTFGKSTPTSAIDRWNNYADLAAYSAMATGAMKPPLGVRPLTAGPLASEEFGLGRAFSGVAKGAGAAATDLLTRIPEPSLVRARGQVTGATRGVARLLNPLTQDENIVLGRKPGTTAETLPEDLATWFRNASPEGEAFGVTPMAGPVTGQMPSRTMPMREWATIRARDMAPSADTPGELYTPTEVPRQTKAQIAKTLSEMMGITVNAAKTLMKKAVQEGPAREAAIQAAVAQYNADKYRSQQTVPKRTRAAAAAAEAQALLGGAGTTAGGGVVAPSPAPTQPFQMNAPGPWNPLMNPDAPIVRPEMANVANRLGLGIPPEMPGIQAEPPLTAPPAPAAAPVAAEPVPAPPVATEAAKPTGKKGTRRLLEAEAVGDVTYQLRQLGKNRYIFSAIQNGTNQELGDGHTFTNEADARVVYTAGVEAAKRLDTAPYQPNPQGPMEEAPPEEDFFPEAPTPEKASRRQAFESQKFSSDHEALIAAVTHAHAHKVDAVVYRDADGKLRVRETASVPGPVKMWYEADAIGDVWLHQIDNHGEYRRVPVELPIGARPLPVRELPPSPGVPREVDTVVSTPAAKPERKTTKVKATEAAKPKGMDVNTAVALREKDAKAARKVKSGDRVLMRGVEGPATIYDVDHEIVGFVRQSDPAAHLKYGSVDDILTILPEDGSIPEQWKDFVETEAPAETKKARKPRATTKQKVEVQNAERNRGRGAPQTQAGVGNEAGAQPRRQGITNQASAAPVAGGPSAGGGANQTHAAGSAFEREVARRKRRVAAERRAYGGEHRPALLARVQAHVRRVADIQSWPRDDRDFVLEEIKGLPNNVLAWLGRWIERGEFDMQRYDTINDVPALYRDEVRDAVGWAVREQKIEFTGRDPITKEVLTHESTHIALKEINKVFLDLARQEALRMGAALLAALNTQTGRDQVTGGDAEMERFLMTLQTDRTILEMKVALFPDDVDWNEQANDWVCTPHPRMAAALRNLGFDVLDDSDQYASLAVYLAIVEDILGPGTAASELPVYFNHELVAYRAGTDFTFADQLFENAGPYTTPTAVPSEQLDLFDTPEALAKAMPQVLKSVSVELANYAEKTINPKTGLPFLHGRLAAVKRATFAMSAVDSKVDALVHTRPSGLQTWNAWSISDILADHPELIEEVRAIERVLTAEGAPAPTLDENNQLFLSPIENQAWVPPTGKKKSNAVPPPPGYRKAKFGSFKRSLTHSMLDHLPEDVAREFRQALSDSVEYAYLQAKGNPKNFPLDFVGFAPNSKGKLEKVTEFLESPEKVGESRLHVFSALKGAEKTYGAINLAALCPMFMIGAMSCYLNGCYVTAMAAGGSIVKLYDKSFYAGEILRLPEWAIRALNKAGGLRLNGIGDTVYSQHHKEQLVDILRHAKMRNLNLKIISKQDGTFKMLNEIAQEAINEGEKNPLIGHIVAQPTIDPYWIPVTLDIAPGSWAEDLMGPDPNRAITNPRVLEEIARQYNLVVGRDTKMINGVLYRKYGFSWESYERIRQDYPLVAPVIKPRVVVSTPREIAEWALKHPEAIQTWMHSSIPAGMYSEVENKVFGAPSDMNNFTARIRLFKDKIGRWHVEAMAAKPLETLGHLEKKLDAARENAQAKQEKLASAKTEGQRATAVAQLEKALEQLSLAQAILDDFENNPPTPVTEVRKAYTSVTDYIYANYTNKQADRIFRTLSGQLKKDGGALCCRAGASADACFDCKACGSVKNEQIPTKMGPSTTNEAGLTSIATKPEKPRKVIHPSEMGFAVVGVPFLGELTALKEDLGNFWTWVGDTKRGLDAIVGQSPTGALMARNLDAYSGRVHQYAEQFFHSRRKVLDHFDRMPSVQRMEFLHNLINNQPQANQTLQSIADWYSDQLKAYWDEEKAVRPDMGYIEHYWPQGLSHAAQQYIRRRYNGESPQAIKPGRVSQGLKFTDPSFLHYREGPRWTLQIMTELKKQGLMKEDNPEVLFQTRALQHMRFMSMHDALTKSLEAGALQPSVGGGKHAVKLRGNVLAVLGRDAIARQVGRIIANQHRYDDMVAAGRRDLLNRDIVAHWEMRPEFKGGSFRRSVSLKGWANQGHMAAIPQGKGIDWWMKNASLADLASYGRHNAERAAYEGEWEITGDDSVVNILNMEFSPSIYTSKYLGGVLRALKWITYAYMRVLLSFPAFHAVATGISTLSTGLADVGEALAKGMPKVAGRAALSLLIFPELYTGHKALNEYRRQPYEKLSPSTKAFVDVGGSVGMPRDMRTGHWAGMKRRAREGAIIRAGGHAMMLLPEAFAKAVMEEWVPSLKLAADARRYAIRLGELQAGKITQGEFEALRSRDFDQIENVFGEMNMDRLHVPRAAVEILKLIFPTLTWRGGSARTLVGAVKDVALHLRALGATAKSLSVQKGIQSIPVESRGISTRLSFIANEIVVTALVSSMMMHAFTGQWPSQALDFIQPRDGGVTREGLPSRMRFPSYLSRDWAAMGRVVFTHRWKDVVDGPWDYVTSGYTPFGRRLKEAQDAWKYSAPGETLNNMVYAIGGDFPMELAKAAGSAATFQGTAAKGHLKAAAASTAAPIATQIWGKTEKSPHPAATHLLQTIGVSTSPKWATDTPAWRMIHEVQAVDRAGRPYLESQRKLSAERAELRQKLEDETITEEEMASAVQTGIVGPNWFRDWERKQGYTPLQSALILLPLKQRLAIYAAMTPKEKVEFEDMFDTETGRKF